jgi:hypothetical protein
MLAAALIALSAGLIAVLGLVHLVYTFRGSKLHPKDSELRSKMENAPPVLTIETTMWQARIGFNASHSLGMMLLGVIHGYFALPQRRLLFRSRFLLLTGFMMLTAYAYLATRFQPPAQRHDAETAQQSDKCHHQEEGAAFAMYAAPIMPSATGQTIVRQLLLTGGTPGYDNRSGRKPKHG